MKGTVRGERLISPTSSVRSYSMSSQSKHPKILIPKNSKLSTFFNTTNRQPLTIEGRPKPVTQNTLRLTKAHSIASLKSLASSSLVRKMIQSVKKETQCKLQREQSESFCKDDSKTRSRLTIMEEYGVIIPEVKKTQRQNALSPKVPKAIRSTSGKNKIAFPIKTRPGLKREEKKITLRNCNSAKSLEYTFGVQGVSSRMNKKQ